MVEILRSNSPPGSQPRQRLVRIFHRADRARSHPKVSISGKHNALGSKAAGASPASDRPRQRGLDRTETSQLSGEIIVGMDVGTPDGTTTLPVLCCDGVVK